MTSIDTEVWAAANRKIRDAMDEVGLLRQENMRLRDLVEVLVQDKTELPLWRRIANQRRELKWANHYSELYYRLYRDRITNDHD